MSIADMLKTDAVFEQWWNYSREAKGTKLRMAISNSSNQNVPAHGISHANREMDQIGVAWVNVSSKGSKYLRGTLEDGRQILAFPNNNKQAEQQPDWQLYVLRYTDEEKQILADYAAERRAEREAKAAQYAQQRQQGQAQPQGQAQAAQPAATGGLPL